MQGPGDLEVSPFYLDHVAIKDLGDLGPDFAGVVSEGPVLAHRGRQYTVVLGPALFDGREHIGGHLIVRGDLVDVHVGQVQGIDQVGKLRFQKLGPFEVRLLPDSMDHVDVLR